MAGPVDELVDDFLALRRDGRVPAWRSLEADHGALEFCGDEVHMTLTFVGSDGLTLLTAGTIEQTVTYFEEMQRSQGRGPRYGWVAKVQAARAVWGGETRGFRPLGSGRVVGVIERGKAALVLGIVDSNCVVVLVDERRRTLLGAWQCQHLGVVDVDTYLRLEAPRRSAVKRDPQDVSDRITLALRKRPVKPW